MTIKNTIENKIEALFLASSTTIDQKTQFDIAKKVNRLNGFYLKRYGTPYHPFEDLKESRLDTYNCASVHEADIKRINGYVRLI